MIKLHFPAGRPELKPRPSSAKFTRWSEYKPHPSPLYKNTGGGKGQRKERSFSP